MGIEDARRSHASHPSLVCSRARGLRRASRRLERPTEATDSTDVEEAVAGSCVYVNPFSDGEECKEYTGASWTPETAATDCEAPLLTAGPGTFTAEAGCVAESELGRCVVGFDTPEETVLVFPGTDVGQCGSVQLGCSFAQGFFQPSELCQDAVDPGVTENVFIPFEEVCVDPVQDEPDGDGPDGQVCTTEGISACTEEGRDYVDYASCDPVYTQRPYAPSTAEANTPPDDPRYDDAEWMAEFDWVTEQVESCACICCHSSEVAPRGSSDWYLEADGLWIDSVDDDGLAMLAGWVDSTAFGAIDPEDNNGFDRHTTGLPTTNVARMQAFLEGELARRGFEESDFSETEPFGGPLYDQLVYEPEACGEGQGVDENGDLIWTGARPGTSTCSRPTASRPACPPTSTCPRAPTGAGMWTGRTTRCGALSPTAPCRRGRRRPSPSRARRRPWSRARPTTCTCSATCTSRRRAVCSWRRRLLASPWAGSVWLERVDLFGALRSPVDEAKLAKVAEVLGVRGDQRQAVDGGNGGDLAIDERGRSAGRSESRALRGVPRCSAGVVRKDGEGRLDALTEVGVQGALAAAVGERGHPVHKLVPGDGWDGDGLRVALEGLHDRGVGTRADGLREHVGVDQEGDHHDTFRPSSRGRTSVSHSSGSSPSAARWCSSRKASSVDQNDGPRRVSRSYSATEISRATRWPRRVSSMGSPSSASWISRESWSFAAAMDTTLDTCTSWPSRWPLSRWLGCAATRPVAFRRPGPPTCAMLTGPGVSMSACRVLVSFRAKPGQGGTVRAVLAEALHTTVEHPACLEAELLVQRDAPEELVVMQRWRSAEHHQANAQKLADLPAIRELLDLLEVPPDLRYLDEVEQGGGRWGGPEHLEIGSDDMGATQAFLEDVFGWRFRAQLETYAMFSAPAGLFGGLRPRIEDAEPSPQTVPYLTVDDLDARIQQVQAAGGVITVPPQEVPGAGRFFWFVAPGGVPMAVWENADG